MGECRGSGNGNGGMKDLAPDGCTGVDDMGLNLKLKGSRFSPELSPFPIASVGEDGPKYSGRCSVGGGGSAKLFLKFPLVVACSVELGILGAASWSATSLDDRLEGPGISASTDSSRGRFLLGRTTLLAKSSPLTPACSFSSIMPVISPVESRGLFPRIVGASPGRGRLEVVDDALRGDSDGDIWSLIGGYAVDLKAEGTTPL
jgi:hypothetical protein